MNKSELYRLIRNRFAGHKFNDRDIYTEFGDIIGEEMRNALASAHETNTKVAGYDLLKFERTREYQLINRKECD